MIPQALIQDNLFHDTVWGCYCLKLVTFFQIVNVSSYNNFMKIDVKSILTNIYEYWPRTSLNRVFRPARP